MSDQRNGGIVWTNQTWNPLRGCSRVSAGCVNCYAEAMAARFCGPGQPYEGTINPETKRWNGNIKLVPEKLTEPLRWTRPRRVFVNSMSDLFHPAVPDEFIDQVFAVMALAPQHTFQVLTKRPERMLDYILHSEGREMHIDSSLVPKFEHVPFEWPLPNVWLGVTVENQQAADERIPLLLDTPAAVRWVSAEPLVGPVDLSEYLAEWCDECNDFHREEIIEGFIGIDWVVAGGESGPHARPMVLGWAKDIVRQCKAAGVPVLVKQIGANPTNREGEPHQISDRKGAIMEEWPEELRIREYPR